jgi:hypothetical protein
VIHGNGIAMVVPQVQSIPAVCCAHHDGAVGLFRRTVNVARQTLAQIRWKSDRLSSTIAQAIPKSALKTFALSGTICPMTKRVHMAPPPRKFRAEKGEETTLLAWMSLASWCALFVMQAIT